MSYEGVPGLVETIVAHDETTLVVDPARLVDACTHLRDELGFNFLSDLTPTDYLGWGAPGVSGYIGTPGGRDLHDPGTQGLARVPDAKPKRFAVNTQTGDVDPRITGALLELRATKEARASAWSAHEHGVRRVFPKPEHRGERTRRTRAQLPTAVDRAHRAFVGLSLAHRPQRRHEPKPTRPARYLLGGTMNGTTCSRPSKPER